MTFFLMLLKLMKMQMQQLKVRTPYLQMMHKEEL
jgi:hypothetical protein